MKRILVGAVALALSAIPGAAQSMDDLNLQIHGYATQGFLYTNQNNIFTTNSSDGSPAWSEAVVNVASVPTPGLRVGVQARFFLLGNVGNAITLDWAAADYTVSERFGVRFGKVKTPSGLFNELQDIDPSYMWSLLPQGTYPITSRNSFLSHYGGVVYGNLALGQKLGKLEYRGWGGERVLGGDDGYFISQREAGVGFPNGFSEVMSGAALHWRTPLRGLMIGASDTRNNQAAAKVTVGGGALTGTESPRSHNEVSYFGRFEKNKFFMAAEYYRDPLSVSIVFPRIPTSLVKVDARSWYGMASYKISDKFTGGIYLNQAVNLKIAPGPARFSKDWAVSGRYDFNQFLYAKAEQHFIDGTVNSYDANLNPGGLKADTRLSILKIGVSF